MTTPRTFVVDGVTFTEGEQRVVDGEVVTVVAPEPHQMMTRKANGVLWFVDANRLRPLPPPVTEVSEELWAACEAWRDTWRVLACKYHCPHNGCALYRAIDAERERRAAG